MSAPTRWRDLVQAAQAELRQLTTVNKTDRLWQMPVAAALASGLPLKSLRAVWNRRIVSCVRGSAFFCHGVCCCR